MTIELGTHIGSGPRGNVGNQKHSFQYVPLFSSLKALLNKQEVCDEVL